MSAIQKGFFLVIISWLFIGCDNDRFDIDVSSVSIDQRLVRIDEALSASVSVRENHEDILSKESLIYGVYYQDILQLGDIIQPSAHENLKGFLKDPMMTEVQAEIVKAFPEGEIYEEAFQDAFRHYKHYFPKESTPHIAFYNSGFNYGIYPTPEFIGIGLEWYIGKDNKMLERLPPSQFPQYLRDKMDPSFMVADALRGYLLVKYSDKVDGKQLINQLVYFGKIAYLMDACMPDAADHLKYGYQASQAEWCKQNEFQVWKSLVSEDLLYSKDRKMINGFIGNAPFTKGFSDKSPGKIAFFIGKMMVKDYAEANPKVTLKQLLNASYEDVLNAYRPNK